MNRQSALVDSMGRRITTLRISLTDRCNFRCVYCMPPEGVEHLPRAEYLSRDEIVRFVSLIASLGVSRYRLTGGEPLLRDDIVELVRELRAIDGVEELSMTTNGSHLDKMAVALRDAGLDRINISLDSLDPERFARIVRRSSYERVFAGVEAAIDAGFYVKINVVVLGGMTEEEILAFARLAHDRQLEVRFLEFMPLCGTGWEPGKVMTVARARSTVMDHFELTELTRGDRPAQTFAITGGGRVGFIASLSEPFCEQCSRVRLTADGKLRPCLFSNYEVDLGALLQGDGIDEEIVNGIREAVWNKPPGSQFSARPFGDDDHSDFRTTETPLIRSIGG